MSCGTCGIQASNTMQGDTGVPAGAPTTPRSYCPHCGASRTYGPCQRPYCPSNPHLGDWGDRPPNEQDRAAACRQPTPAFLYARDVEGAPHDDTRRAVCAPTDSGLHEEASVAYRYARDVDKAPHEDTRQAACGKPRYAFLYAREVDRQPTALTRQAASQDPDGAAEYRLWEDTFFGGAQ